MSSSRRNAALDGLRGLAIAAVVAYHANTNWLPGGFFGVTVFLVASGYLTTMSVARRLSGKNGFDYPAFLARRVARLLPTMVAVVGVTGAVARLASPGLVAKLRADAVPALLFLDNIHYIVGEVSYFAAAGLPSAVTHFWYLGVLMQLTVVWPLVLMAVWRLKLRRRPICLAVGAAALASALEMALLFDPAGDTARVYYGTDTRAAEFLVGGLLALATLGGGLTRARDLFAPRTGKGRGERAVPAWALALIGASALAGLCAMCLLSDGFSPFAYRGGLLLAALLSAIVVGVVTERDAGPLGALLGSAPLAGLGKRSLHIYLWHYPLLLMMNPANRTTQITWWGWALEMALILAISEVSYRLFEAGGASSTGPLGLSKPARAVAAAALVGVVATVALPAPQVLDARPETAAQTAEEKKAAAEAAAAAKAAAAAQEYDLSGTYFAGTAFEEAVEAINKTSFNVDADTGATDANVLLIGDSVPDDASAEFYEIFPNGFMDAKIGRQLTAGPDVYRACVEGGHDADVVVWSIADNGWVTEAQVEELVSCLDSSKKVYFVTCRCPDAFQDNNNEVLRAVADKHDNVQVIDWYAESEGHDEWFWNDGEHVRPEGAEAYVMMLRRAITGR